MGTTAAGDHHEGEHEHRSRWPLVAAVGAAGIYAGVGLALVGLDLVPLPIPLALIGGGVLALVVGLAGWTYEAFVADYWARQADRARIYRAGMVLFLVSDVATFAAGFVYYFFVRSSDVWGAGDVPHLLGSLVLVNTVVLLASSVTVHYAHGALERDDRRQFLAGLGVTVLLGVVFLGGQALEYYELLVVDGFTISTGVFGSAFYGLTGLHGAHVALGVVMLAVTFGRALRGHYSAERATAVSTVSLYWHFVDAVWVFLVLVVYAGADWPL